MPYIAEDKKIYYSISELSKFLNLSRGWLIEVSKRKKFDILKVPRGRDFTFFLKKSDAKKLAKIYGVEL